LRYILDDFLQRQGIDQEDEEMEDVSNVNDAYNQ